ncbi:hypothetical protein CHUAL_006365 [Chamberlinius hualienensis]
MSKYAIVFLCILNGLLITCQAQKATRCSDLPKQPFPVNGALVYGGQYIYDYSSQPYPRCATGAFMRPLFGKKYEGSFAIFQGNAVTTYDYSLSLGRTKATFNICAGQYQYWYLAEANFFPYGSYYCTYVCDADGIGLVDFSCATNNRTAFLDDEQRVISQASEVPNYNKIHAISQDCFTNGCQALY